VPLPDLNASSQKNTRVLVECPLNTSLFGGHEENHVSTTVSTTEFKHCVYLVIFQVLTTAKMSGMLCRVAWQAFTDVFKVMATSNIRAMNVKTDRSFRGAYCLQHGVHNPVNASKTSVNFHRNIRRNIPEESHLQGADRTQDRRATVRLSPSVCGFGSGSNSVSISSRRRHNPQK
jgi:hypothetical protein